MLLLIAEVGGLSLSHASTEMLGGLVVLTALRLLDGWMLLVLLPIQPLRIPHGSVLPSLLIPSSSLSLHLAIIEVEVMSGCFTYQGHTSPSAVFFHCSHLVKLLKRFRSSEPRDWSPG